MVSPTYAGHNTVNSSDKLAVLRVMLDSLSLYQSHVHRLEDLYRQEAEAREHPVGSVRKEAI